MATSPTLVSVEEYLTTTYKPACEYIDGVLHQKPMPTWMHGLIQGQLCTLINQGFRSFLAAAEITVRIRPKKYLVPDVLVQSRDRIQAPYPTEPVHLCIEILSPDNPISEIFAKCEEYHEWGVATTWIVDPDWQRAWEYRKGLRPTEVPSDGSLTAEGISIPLRDVFSV